LYPPYPYSRGPSKWSSPNCREISMISGVLAVRRVWTLRLGFGSFASRFTSLIGSGLRGRPLEAEGERGVAERPKRLQRRGDVEVPVRDRSFPGRALHGDRPRRQRHDLFGHRSERVRCARGHVHDALAAMREHEGRQRGDVVDEHVIPLLFAVAEQRDRLALGGETAETIGPIPLVRITGAVDERRAKDGQWRLSRP